MWKQIYNFTKSVTATYQRLTQAEENIKKTLARSEKHDTEINDGKQRCLAS